MALDARPSNCRRTFRVLTMNGPTLKHEWQAPDARA
jgi:hypothetical protein